MTGKGLLISSMIVMLTAYAAGCSTGEGARENDSSRLTEGSNPTLAVEHTSNYTLDATVMKVVGVYQLRITSDIRYSQKSAAGEMANGDGYLGLYVNGELVDKLVNNNPFQLQDLQEGSNTVKVVFTTNDGRETDLVKELSVEVPKAKDITLDQGTLRNESGKVLIKSVTLNKAGVAGHSTLGIVSQSGTVIVSDPNNVPAAKGLIKADVITTSHSHGDHMDTPFTQRNAEAGGTRFSVTKEETFKVKDVTITGIAGGHNSNYDPERPDNYIYVYEVDGITIANLADYGQDELTEEQIQKMGKVDIVILPMTDNTQPGFSVEKSIKAIRKLQPKIISPIHFSRDAIDDILGEFNITDRSEVEELTIDSEDIAAINGMKYVFLK